MPCVGHVLRTFRAGAGTQGPGLPGPSVLLQRSSVSTGMGLFHLGKTLLQE